MDARGIESATLAGYDGAGVPACIVSGTLAGARARAGPIGGTTPRIARNVRPNRPISKKMALLVPMVFNTARGRRHRRQSARTLSPELKKMWSPKLDMRRCHVRATGAAFEIRLSRYRDSFLSASLSAAPTTPPTSQSSAGLRDRPKLTVPTRRAARCGDAVDRPANSRRRSPFTAPIAESRARARPFLPARGAGRWSKPVWSKLALVSCEARRQRLL